jgi:hypothetical protein
VLSKVFGRGGILARSLANAIDQGPVDVVVAWVDGRDRKHRAKRRRYLADPGGDTKPQRVAVKAHRFSDSDEIRYCLRSIHNYAPWVRTIWLVTDDQVPSSIARRRAERYNIRIVDHREIFRGYEQLLPTFNSLAIETMLWRIEGLADRFLYFNDDMMLVGPVKPTDFFSRGGKVKLRGRWTSWTELVEQTELLEQRIAFNAYNKLVGAEMVGYTAERFFTARHVIYPLLRPVMEQLFEEFQSAFLANAKYRFRDRKQFWPVSLHDHLLLKSNRARIALPQNSAHFSVGDCLTASPDDLELRLKQLTTRRVRMTCINHLEAVIDKVPDAMRYLSDATGPPAPFEKPSGRVLDAVPPGRSDKTLQVDARVPAADDGTVEP